MSAASAKLKPEPMPQASTSTSATTVWVMLATYGDLYLGCVLPSARGRIPSRPIA